MQLFADSFMSSMRLVPLVDYDDPPESDQAPSHRTYSIV